MVIVPSSDTPSAAVFTTAGVRGSVSTVTPGVSSSVTVTVTLATDSDVGYPESPAPVVMRWLTVTDSSRPSASPCAVTTTVCAVFHVLAVYVSVPGATATAPVSALVTPTPTVSPAASAVSNTTVYLPTFRFVPPAFGFSCNAMLVGLSVTPAVSSSVIASVAVEPR